MAGRPRTPRHLLSNPRGSRARVAPRIQGGRPDCIPPFPLEDTGERRLALEAWTSLWTSSAGQLVDPVADAVPLYRWMRDIDEYERLSSLCAAAPTVKSASGPRLNPLYARVAQLSRQLAAWEERFGLTPRGRQLLRIQDGSRAVDDILEMLYSPFEDEGDQAEDA
ncbi:hypothetical protein [Tepidiforma thermophila]|uniref:P27 family phage terminase small subunit n=1 Tax=Tepidiforma thermophila (strain KCTC 52669 / CGMCC 1.13589 / G233) TaxID=2761530 RepID=A0A2A9HJY7_TEPT2|nr:hypothetical protein [Tepidiforma thermophila]PFG75306.1 hypothetical protein A9A59_2574 [Tepidiforma thermophila]